MKLKINRLSPMLSDLPKSKLLPSTRIFQNVFFCCYKRRCCNSIKTTTDDLASKQLSKLNNSNITYALIFSTCVLYSDIYQKYAKRHWDVLMILKNPQVFHKWELTFARTHNIPIPTVQGFKKIHNHFNCFWYEHIRIKWIFTSR